MIWFYDYAVAFGWVWGINIYRWVVQRGNQFHFISIKKPFTLFCTWLVESILEHFIERARKLLERISLRIWIWEKVNSKKFLRDGVLLIPSKDVFQLLIKPSLELKATIKPSMFWLKLYEYQSWRGKGSIVNMNKFVCKCQLVKRFFLRCWCEGRFQKLAKAVMDMNKISKVKGQPLGHVPCASMSTKFCQKKH